MSTVSVNNFDVLKRMSLENRDIRLAPSSNIISMKKVKAGTQITIGVAGDVLAAIHAGELVGCLLLFDKRQFDETKASMETQEEVCANCAKPYAQHLHWDGNKCSLGSINGWFPKSTADALGTMKRREP